MKPTPGTDTAGGYGAREVSRMLGLSVAQVRAWVRSGLVEPERGPRGELRFSSHDLELLSAARGLAGARVGPRRIERALSKLRAQIAGPESLADLEISAEGREIVVTDGSARWQPESGQMLMEFDHGPVGRLLALPHRRRTEEPSGNAQAQSWYERGCELEETDSAAAEDAYSRALDADPDLADAHVNLGRLLHERGDTAAAREHYARALAARPDDATAAFNLGVALEDLGRDVEAVETYERVVEIDPSHADAYFNLAGACERLGRPAAAIRHLKTYRTLTRSRSQ